MASTNLFFLLDNSGSMLGNGRLTQINDGVPEVLGAVAQEITKLEVKASVRIITFNDKSEYLFGSVEKGVSLESAISQWQNISAGGGTRTGLAIERVTDSMHTKYLTVDGNMDNKINAPVVILITDGACNPEFKTEYLEKIRELKSKRHTKNGKETVLCIAVGVNDANQSELEEFASEWPTVTGEDSDGNRIVETKKQVYMIDDAENLCNVLPKLAVSSVFSSSITGPAEAEGSPDGADDREPINPLGDVTVTLPGVGSVFTSSYKDDFK